MNRIDRRNEAQLYGFAPILSHLLHLKNLFNLLQPINFFLNPIQITLTPPKCLNHQTKITGFPHKPKKKKTTLAKAQSPSGKTTGNFFLKK